MDYYVFSDKTEADQCISAINGSGWFPIIGKKLGQPNPLAQATVAWVESASEMVTGEYAVPRIPESRLDYLNVPQSDRDNFLAAFGQDIRDLDSSDFPEPPE